MANNQNLYSECEWRFHFRNLNVELYCSSHLAVVGALMKLVIVVKLEKKINFHTVHQKHLRILGYSGLTDTDLVHCLLYNLWLHLFAATLHTSQTAELQNN